MPHTCIGGQQNARPDANTPMQSTGRKASIERGAVVKPVKHEIARAIGFFAWIAY